jgi:hypothetical protein
MKKLKDVLIKAGLALFFLAVIRVLIQLAAGGF